HPRRVGGGAPDRRIGTGGRITVSRPSCRYLRSGRGLARASGLSGQRRRVPRGEWFDPRPLSGRPGPRAREGLAPRGRCARTRARAPARGERQDGGWVRAAGRRVALPAARRRDRGGRRARPRVRERELSPRRVRTPLPSRAERETAADRGDRRRRREHVHAVPRRTRIRGHARARADGRVRIWKHGPDSGRAPQRGTGGGGGTVRAAREGVALILAVVVLLSLGTITASLLFTSALSNRIARTGEDVARARITAESAARSTLASWETRRYRDLSIGEAVEVEEVGDGASAVVERLTGGLFLVRASAEFATGTRARVGLLVRGLDIRDLVGAFPAAITTGGALELGDGAVLEGGAGAPAPPPWSEAECPPHLKVLVAETFGLVPRPAHAKASETVWGGPFDPADPLRLG